MCIRHCPCIHQTLVMMSPWFTWLGPGSRVGRQLFLQLVGSNGHAWWVNPGDRGNVLSLPDGDLRRQVLCLTTGMWLSCLDIQFCWWFWSSQTSEPCVSYGKNMFTCWTWVKDGPFLLVKNRDHESQSSYLFMLSNALKESGKHWSWFVYFPMINHY